jgi:hypothetical protein
MRNRGRWWNHKGRSPNSPSVSLFNFHVSRQIVRGDEKYSEAFRGMVQIVGYEGRYF